MKNVLRTCELINNLIITQRQMYTIDLRLEYRDIFQLPYCHHKLLVVD